MSEVAVEVGAEDHGLGAVIMDRLTRSGFTPVAVQHGQDGADRRGGRVRRDRGALAPIDADALVLLPDRGDAAAQQAHRALIARAAASGVRTVVDVAAVGSDTAEVRELAAAAGLAHTSLRIPLHEEEVLGMVGEDGVIRTPAGDQAVAVVARDDVAAAVAAVLADPERAGGRDHLLTGPTAYTFEDVADLLTALTGSWTAYYPQTFPQAFDSRWHAGATLAEISAGLVQLGAIRDGAMARVTDDLPQLIGRPATDLWESLRGHASAQSSRRSLPAAS